MDVETRVETWLGKNKNGPSRPRNPQGKGKTIPNNFQKHIKHLLLQRYFCSVVRVNRVDEALLVVAVANRDDAAQALGPLLYFPAS